MRPSCASTVNLKILNEKASVVSILSCQSHTAVPAQGAMTSSTHLSMPHQTEATASSHAPRSRGSFHLFISLLLTQYQPPASQVSTAQVSRVFHHLNPLQIVPCPSGTLSSSPFSIPLMRKALHFLDPLNSLLPVPKWVMH